MDLEQKVEELKAEIELMKECYFKGFGNLVIAVRLNCGSYLGDRKSEYPQLVTEELNMIEAHYKEISFERLGSNENLAPLFEVRELLQHYGVEVRCFLKEPTQKGLLRIRSLECSMGFWGEVYRDNLNKKLGELRSIPGYEKFRIELVDYKGAHFFM